MTSTELIECVPNISEGRRPEVIEAIAQAVAQVPGALLLDRSSDPDHNRTVLTLAGSAEGLKEAIRTLYTVVLPRIDMRRQEGVHPRMGAVDVVPFIPWREVTMQDCILLARECAAQVARDFGVPVFLYGQAASLPAHKKLGDIRRGGFGGMAAKLADPAWHPDFGPTKPHESAGVSAFGARSFLIAYNILLDTPDVSVARGVAASIRESSGGLPAIQAIGLSLPSRREAQVSMNLLDYQATGLLQVYDRVEAEAARRGAHIVESEIVGLVPKDALPPDAARILRIENWRDDLILENALLTRQKASGSSDPSLCSE